MIISRILNKLLLPFVLLRDLLVELSIKNLSEKKRFELIYRSGYWKPFFGGSLSGSGSNLNSTENIRRELPIFLSEFSIHSMLDLPCGDLYWMSQIDLQNLKYIGGDIVPDIIQENQANFAENNRNFMELNVIEDKLPTVDLIFVRDCLVHLEEQQIIDAIKNIVNSGSVYFSTTTYPKITENQKPVNKDRWRQLNLTLPPFSLPEPIKYLDDSCSSISLDVDKCIGVWRTDDLLDFANRH
jgi:hypothetical protein